MTSDVRPTGAWDLAAGEEKVLTAVTDLLAGLLGLAPGAIDPRRPFRALGFDSMLTVSFVAALNARLGTRLAPAALLEHPTPDDLARHLAAVPPPAVPHGEPGAVATGGADPEEVLAELRRQLAGLLHHAPDPRTLDAEAEYSALGLDSLLAAEFVAGVNHTYHLAETPSVLLDHPSLAALAAHVASRVPARTAPVPEPVAAAPLWGSAPDAPVPALPPASLPASVPLPAPAPAPVPVSVPRPVVEGGGTPGTPGVDLEALLDAVRDDVLSVEEAAALLTGRG
ncbi:acyl carrier protein [Streptomyces mangrovisoli]|uniref:Carrier domain-containing protein n=1 Tax=Streptomyces mangrovisoli TaxID=1428628 RepID=A0A1J4NN88_9ACTN|nr:acyl carrier protein [Streptomyces mangrovisoli]OIJ62741.1 hypothetical protein WN71_037865 [Streptomyces mangrovisoli]